MFAPGEVVSKLKTIVPAAFWVGTDTVEPGVEVIVYGNANAIENGIMESKAANANFSNTFFIIRPSSDDFDLT